MTSLTPPPPPPGATGITAGATGPLNAFMLIDYMNLIIKEGVNDAVSEFRATTVVPGTTGPKSLSQLAAAYPPNSQAPTGVSRIVQIAQANQQIPLATGTTMTFSDVSFVPSPGATLGGIAQRFDVAATALASVENNPQLSYQTLPSGVTAVQLAGPTGETAVGVTGGASFQDVARRYGITGPTAIDSALIWPNLDVVDRLLVPGQPVHIPTFSQAVTGPVSLASLAAYYNLSLDAVATQNADTPIFGETASVAVPQAQTMTVGHLISRLMADGFDQKIAGLAGRALLHGLRVPYPGQRAGPRVGLFEVTGQQVGVSGLTADSLVTLGYPGPTAPAWLHFAALSPTGVTAHGSSLPIGVTGATGTTGATGITGTTGATGPAPHPHVAFPVGVTGMAYIERLAGATAYSPTGSFVELQPYHIYQRSFTLPHSITWNVPQNPPGPTGIVPVGPTGSYGSPAATGDTGASPMGTYFIRAFPSKLRDLLQTGATGSKTTPFSVIKRDNPAPGATAAVEQVTPYAFTTMIQVNVSQVPQENGTSEFVYALQGTSEADKSLLATLLAQPMAPQAIFLLYPARGAQKGQKNAPVALSSDQEPTAFIFHTNPTTTSVPHGGEIWSANARLLAGGVVSSQAVNFLQQIWEVDEVNQGGFYLYYRTAEGKGLPSYLFSQKPNATVTVLMPYGVASENTPSGLGYLIPRYVNSIVLDTAASAKNQGLYVEPVGPASGFDAALQVKTPTIHPGTVAFEISRPNPNYAPGPTVTTAHELDELYSIVEANIPAQAGWAASRPGLPVGPRNPSPGITAGPSPSFTYDIGFPISHLAIGPPGVTGPTGTTGPSALNNPYAGVGETLTVQFDLFDIFGNTLRPSDGPAWLSTTTLPGYTDYLVGIDNWPQVGRSYSVDSAQNIQINLTFNANYFYEIYEADKGTQPDYVSAVLDAAETVQQTFEKIYYQLSRPDVSATIVTSFDPDSSNDVTVSLRDFVTACWVKVCGIVETLRKKRALSPTTPVTPPPLSGPLSDDSGLDIFPMTVGLRIARARNIDPAFADVPGVRQVTSSIPPMTLSGATGTNQLGPFAQAFEEAFPVFKVATGEASSSATAAAPATGAKAIWLVRLGATAADDGIYLNLQDDPIYYAPRPVATSLVSRTGIAIYDIEKGKTLQQMIDADPGCTGGYCHLKNFSAVDLGTLARQFLAAIDQALAPEMAAAAAIASPDDFASLMSSKEALAAILSTADSGGPATTPQVMPVFQDSKPPAGGTTAAGSALENELLAELSNLHKVETIVQCSVESHWNNPTQTDSVVEFFGKLSPQVQTPKPAFAFSGSAIPVTQGATATQLTALFNVNQTHLKSSGPTGTGAPDFVEDATFHVTALAHNIGPGAVTGYHNTDWLSFVEPFELGNGVAPAVTATPPPLGLDIPLPLRAYPTAPSLKGQADVPALLQFGQVPSNAEISISDAATWTYEYSYQYIGASQDTISTSLQFNVAGTTGAVGSYLGMGTDLAADLLQFAAIYPGLAADLAHLPEFLEDNQASTPTAVSAKLALTSLCQIAVYVAQAWKGWSEFQLTYTYQYEIEQAPTGPTAAPLLSVQVSKVQGSSGIYPNAEIPMPGIEIEGFTTHPTPPISATTVGPGATMMNYTFSTTGPSGPVYLGWEDRASYPIRTVSFAGLNVLKQENAWAGVGVVRNKDLERTGPTGGWRPVDPAFIYETPLIRFVNVLNPFLDPAGEIILSDEFDPVEKTLEGYLTALFAKLFKDLSPSASVLVKLAVSYGYMLSENDLPVELPMFLTTPHNFPQTGDPAYITAVSDRITYWFSERGIKPAKVSNGFIAFDLTIFSTLSESQLPMLRLRQLLLYCDKVNWS